MRYRRAGSKIVHERFDDEVVVINLENGCYYSLTGSGPAIWDVLGEPVSGDEIVDSLAGAPGDRADGIARAVEAFLEELAQEGLVESEPAGEPHGAVTRRQPSTELLPPVLRKYTDQRELLLLDPIHEVGDLGWPEKK
jgi:hypothetical protein